MALHLTFSLPVEHESQAVIETILRETYDGLPELYEVSLDYVAGRGWGVVRAIKRTFPGGAYRPGDRHQRGTDTDTIAELRTLLHERGVKVRD